MNLNVRVGAIVAEIGIKGRKCICHGRFSANIPTDLSVMELHLWLHDAASVIRLTYRCSIVLSEM